MAVDENDFVREKKSSENHRVCFSWFLFRSTHGYGRLVQVSEFYAASTMRASLNRLASGCVHN